MKLATQTHNAYINKIEEIPDIFRYLEKTNYPKHDHPLSMKVRVFRGLPSTSQICFSIQHNLPVWQSRNARTRVGEREFCQTLILFCFFRGSFVISKFSANPHIPRSAIQHTRPSTRINLILQREMHVP